MATWYICFLQLIGSGCRSLGNSINRQRRCITDGIYNELMVLILNKYIWVEIILLVLLTPATMEFPRLPSIASQLNSSFLQFPAISNWNFTFSKICLLLFNHLPLSKIKRGYLESQSHFISSEVPLHLFRPKQISCLIISNYS